jgi:hypothetical protein
MVLGWPAPELQFSLVGVQLTERATVFGGGYEVEGGPPAERCRTGRPRIASRRHGRCRSRRLRVSSPRYQRSSIQACETHDLVIRVCRNYDLKSRVEIQLLDRVS